MTKEEKFRDSKVALGVSKFMVKLGFVREKLMCKLYSNYVSYGQEIKQKGVCVARFPLKLEQASKWKKGKRERIRGLMGKRGA